VCVCVCVCVIIFLVSLPFSQCSDYCQIIIVMNWWWHWATFVWSCNYHTIINVCLYERKHIILFIYSCSCYRPNHEINCATTLWKAQCHDSLSKNSSITSLSDVNVYSLSHQQARCVTDNFGVWWVHSWYIVHDINAWRKDVLPPFYLQTTTEQILMNSGHQALGELKRLNWKLSGKFNLSSCNVNITP
jgi:hypothetical protein